jgi:Ca2+-binding EF-hand superfamily protein
MARFAKMMGILLMAVLFLWSASTLAQAAQGGGNQPNTGLFGEMDKNGDGKVTQEEFKAFYGDVFNRMKKDEQGNVTVENLTVYYAARFKVLDKNGDGVIARDEYATPGIDANGDGKTTLAEWSAFFVAQVKVMDTDKDGKVTPQEYNAYCAAHFKAADKDGDGVIILKEWMTPRAPEKKGAKEQKK